MTDIYPAPLKNFVAKKITFESEKHLEAVVKVITDTTSKIGFEDKNTLFYIPERILNSVLPDTIVTSKDTSIANLIEITNPLFSLAYLKKPIQIPSSKSFEKIRASASKANRTASENGVKNTPYLYIIRDNDPENPFHRKAEMVTLHTQNRIAYGGLRQLKHNQRNKRSHNH